MTQTSTLWLPLGTKTEVEAALQISLSKWAKQWFVDQPVLKVSQTPVTALRKVNWQGGNGVFAGLEDGVSARLGLAICGGVGDLTNQQDCALLERLAADACLQLAELLRAGPAKSGQECSGPVPPGSDDCFLVSPSGREWSIALAMSAETVVRLRRSSAPSMTTFKLGSLSAALANETCAIAVNLGQAELSSAELASLGIGDVVVFDRATDQALPLVIEGRSPERGTAKLQSTGGELRVLIADPISLNARETLSA